MKSRNRGVDTKQNRGSLYSPLGMGYGVDDGPVGEIKIGVDGLKWIRKKYVYGNVWVHLGVNFSEYVELYTFDLNTSNKKIKKSRNRRCTPRKKPVKR